MIDPTVSNSIIYGSLVGLMCVGLTATYLTTKVPNFAASDFVVVGIYASAAPYIVWGVRSPYYTVPISVVCAGLTAVLMYLVVLRPLIRRGSSLVVLMIATLAVDFIFTGIFELFVNYMGAEYGRLLNDRGYGGQFFDLQQLPDFKLFGDPGLLFVAPIVLVVSTAGLYFLLTKTRFGVAMRASIENANLAKTLGINVEVVNVVSWFLAGALAGLAGGLYAIFTGSPENTSSLIIVDIFAGSVLGGLASIYGAIIGGFIVGAAETFVTVLLVQLFSAVYNPSVASEVLDFQKGIPLAIMIIVLMVAPQGLVAITRQKRVKKRMV